LQLWNLNNHFNANSKNTTHSIFILDMPLRYLDNSANFIGGLLMENLKKNSDQKSKTHTTSQMDMCIQNCLDCYRACEERLAESFSNKESKIKSSHLLLLKSCAEISHTSAKFLMMQSKFHNEICGVCAKVCKECANTLKSIRDEGMNECAEACEKCADSCNEMAKMKH